MESSTTDYSSLFYLSPFPKWVYDIGTFQILDANDAAVLHYGYSREEFLKLTIKDLRPTDEIPKMMAAHADIDSMKENIYFGVFTHQKKSGEKIRMKINGHKVDFQGKNCILVVCQDVTEEERQALAIKASEERLKAASSIAKLGYWRQDLETDKLTWSDEIFKIWERERSTFEVSFKNFFESIHPDDKEQFKIAQKATFEGKGDLDFIHRILLPDGRIKWVHELARLIRDTHEKPIILEGTVQDISSQKESELHLGKITEQLIESESKFRTIFEIASLGIVQVDPANGQIVLANSFYEAITGYSKEELFKINFVELTHPDDREKDWEVFSKAMRGEGEYRNEKRYVKKDGTIVWVRLHVAFIRDERGKPVRTVAICEDISKEKKLTQLHSQASSLAKIGSWEIDLLHQKLTWTPIVHLLHETDPESFVPDLETAINFYREDFQNLVRQNIQDCISEGKAFNFEAVIVTAKNNERWIRAIGNAEFFESKCIRIYGSFQDIHERKEAENRHQFFTDNLPGVVFQYVIHPDGTDFLRFVSKGAKEIWGFTAEESEQNNQLVWDQIKAGGDFEAVQASIVDSAKNKSSWKANWRYLKPNGELRNHSSQGIPEFLIDGTIIFNSMILDVTDEKKIEDLLKQTTAMAKIGSWELDLVNQDHDAMYWSPMTRKILEVDEGYNPTLTGGLEFYSEKSKIQIQKAVDLLIQEGTEFDLELDILSNKGNNRWVRCIGKSQRVQGKVIKIFGSFQDIHEQKSIEIELKKSLRTIGDYKFALDQAAIIAITNAKGIITFVNENFCKISKYTAEEILGNTHRLINSKYHSKAFFADLWKTIGGGNVWRGEIKNLAKDGTYYWVDTTIVPFNDEKNSPTQYLAIRFDISDRKIADESIGKMLEEKNSILESIGDAFFSVTNDWQVTYWNKEAEKLLGKKREDIIGKNLWEVYPDAIDTGFYHQYRKAIETQQTVSFEEHYSTLDIWFEVTGYPSLNGLSVYFKDVTLRKQADIRLLKANERFEKATEATNDAIWDWDIENDTFFRSNGIEKFFGKDTSKSLTEGNFWKDKFHGDDLPTIQQSLEEALKNPAISRWEMEYRIHRENDEIRHVVDKGVIIRNQSGKAVRMVGAMTDVSDRKQNEEELLALNESLKTYAEKLELTNEQLEQFAFIASHDLQEPLRMISSFLDQLKRKYGEQLDDKAHEYIRFATDGAKRMKQIILDLLEYSRAGKFEENKCQINLDLLVYEYKSLRKKIIEEKSALIIHSQLPVIEGFRAPFTQVIHCLLDNAIKYSTAGVAPRIELNVTECEQEWIFAVRDNGIGISPEFFDKIFVIFQRLHNRDRYEGSGVGLSIVKKQVESWGGRVWLESVEGEGTQFYFTLPKRQQG